MAGSVEQNRAKRRVVRGGAVDALPGLLIFCRGVHGDLATVAPDFLAPLGAC